ncbi:hypothetical protein CRM22_002395 [Opisthorchis felineus]|uniref:Uncharacterized protein n=1 Tax=Opisthorchis felineus TaxID=147828 RepID=A0A4S2MC82_OPIFE|nr:hypothetical protein CRM22_002395 [Opisthorchis felineus]
MILRLQMQWYGEGKLSLSLDDNVLRKQNDFENCRAQLEQGTAMVSKTLISEESTKVEVTHDRPGGTYDGVNFQITDQLCSLMQILVKKSYCQHTPQQRGDFLHRMVVK